MGSCQTHQTNPTISKVDISLLSDEGYKIRQVEKCAETLMESYTDYLTNKEALISLVSYVKNLKTNGLRFFPEEHLNLLLLDFQNLELDSQILQGIFDTWFILSYNHYRQQQNIFLLMNIQIVGSVSQYDRFTKPSYCERRTPIPMIKRYDDFLEAYKHVIFFLINNIQQLKNQQLQVKNFLENLYYPILDVDKYIRYKYNHFNDLSPAKMLDFISHTKECDRGKWIEYIVHCDAGKMIHESVNPLSVSEILKDAKNIQPNKIVISHVGIFTIISIKYTSVYINTMEDTYITPGLVISGEAKIEPLHLFTQDDYPSKINILIRNIGMNNQQLVVCRGEVLE